MRENINRWMNKIQVQNRTNADVEVKNNSQLNMIGKGRHGAVFLITDDICLKVFGNTEDCEREYHALSLGQHTNLLPRIYWKGSLYIAMEMIKGVDLGEYLQFQPLTPELSQKLIEMLITFKDIGYERIDYHKRQIYLQEDGTLKVINVDGAVCRDRGYPYPQNLLTSFGEENERVFLSHVQEMAPQLYGDWLNSIRSKYFQGNEPIQEEVQESVQEPIQESKQQDSNRNKNKHEKNEKREKHGKQDRKQEKRGKHDKEDRHGGDGKQEKHGKHGKHERNGRHR